MRSLKHIFILIPFLFSGVYIKAQEEAEKKAPDLTFTVKKLTDGSFELKSRLSLFENKIDYPVSGAIVNFTIGSADSLVRIENNVTDRNGYAYAFIKAGNHLKRDPDGVINATAAFAGDSKYEPAEAEATFTETRLTVLCEMVDTIKTVKVEAYKINADGTEAPLKEEAVTVSVQRMFSRLPIGEVTLDEEGKGSVEFPVNLPGDSVGNLQVVAFIADHEIYGNIEASTEIKWGIPKQQVLVTHRALWTQIAPLWMIVSLTILLIGVWAHYIYVIIQLIIVKLKGAKQ